MDKQHNCLKDFFNRGKYYLYKNGQAILRADEIPTDAFFIDKGYVKIYSETLDGNEKLHIIYKPGDIFPWIWIFKGVAKDVYYQALGQVGLWKRSKKDLLDFLKQSCTALEGCPIMFEVMDKIIDILNVHVDRVDNLEQTKAYPRVIARLIFLAKRFADKISDEVKFSLPITHQDIADSINMTRETASREIEKLEKKGLIKYIRHSLVIPSLKKLEDELQTHYERKQL